jgi:hypothetical protein
MCQHRHLHRLALAYHFCSGMVVAGCIAVVVAAVACASAVVAVRVVGVDVAVVAPAESRQHCLPEIFPRKVLFGKINVKKRR